MSLLHPLCFPLPSYTFSRMQQELRTRPLHPQLATRSKPSTHAQTHAHLQVHLRDKPISPDLDYKELAALTGGMSGAQVRGAARLNF